MEAKYNLVEFSSGYFTDSQFVARPLTPFFIGRTHFYTANLGNFSVRKLIFTGNQHFQKVIYYYYYEFIASKFQAYRYSKAPVMCLFIISQ